MFRKPIWWSEILGLSMHPLLFSITLNALSELYHNLQLHLHLQVDIVSCRNHFHQLLPTDNASCSCCIQLSSVSLVSVSFPVASGTTAAPFFLFLETLFFKILHKWLFYWALLPPLSRGDFFLTTWILDLFVLGMVGWRVMYCLLTKSCLNIHYIP